MNHPFDWWAKERNGEPLPQPDRLRVWEICRRAWHDAQKQPDPEQRQELYEQYEHELQTQTGFGHPSHWANGPRNFAQFLAERRLSSDFDKALHLTTAPLGVPGTPNATATADAKGTL
jgi:hypothetical protein